MIDDYMMNPTELEKMIETFNNAEDSDAILRSKKIIDDYMMNP